MTEESRILQGCIKYAAQAGIFCQRRQLGAYIVGNRRVKGKSHQSDLWGISRSGKHWEWEAKKPGEQPTEGQEKWLRECAAAGAIVGWGDSLDDFVGFVRLLV
jgi:hypothetical protein